MQQQQQQMQNCPTRHKSGGLFYVSEMVFVSEQKTILTHFKVDYFGPFLDYAARNDSDTMIALSNIATYIRYSSSIVL